MIEAEKGGLFRSDDGGETWSLASESRGLRQRAWTRDEDEQRKRKQPFHAASSRVEGGCFNIGLDDRLRVARVSNPCLAAPIAQQGTAASGSLARDCGDFADACQSGYTFFRRATNTQATADQYDSNHEWIYVVYDASKGPILETGTTYGTISPGKAAQTAAYFVRYNGATGAVDLGPTLLDDQAVGHQAFPDVSADGGVLHAFWWDSRHDPCYSPIRPFGSCANRTTVPSLDVFATTSSNHGVSWTTPVKITDTMSNGNFEQFDNRAVPFGGDYLTITGLGSFAFGTWTDWRDTLQGTDPREAPEDQDAATSDVVQCRVVLTSTGKKGNTIKSWSGDRCPHAGGIDQNIYGATAPSP